MSIIIVVLLVILSVLAAWMFALSRRRHVRTTIKGPWSISVELEADDGDYKPHHD